MGGSGDGDGLVVGGAEGGLFRELEGSDALVAFLADVRLVVISCGGGLFFGACLVSYLIKARCECGHCLRTYLLGLRFGFLELTCG